MKMASKWPAALRCVLALVLLTSAGAQPRLSGSVRTIEEQQSCIQPILRSYLFKGRRYSSGTFKSLLCPTLTRTCCNRFDEQRAFHLVNDVLPPRLLEYREKVKSALIRVRALRTAILARKPNFSGSMARQDFCFREFRRLDNFGWKSFHERLVELLEHTYHEFDSHYSAFYCILCDANNHRNFVFRTNNQGFLLDERFCNDFLEAHTDLLKLWNIDLIGLFINMQNVVDCFHYRTSFNMPFFDEAKRKQLENAGRCMNAIGSNGFLQNCQAICSKINYASIIDLLEGDFEFMTIGANLLEKYLRVREGQDMVSDGLRSFFKSLTMHDPTHPEPLGQLDINFDMFRVGFDYDPQVQNDTHRGVIRDESLSWDIEDPEHVNEDPAEHSVFRRKLVQRSPAKERGGSSRVSKSQQLPEKQRAQTASFRGAQSRHLGDYKSSQPLQTQAEANSAPPAPAFNPRHKRQLQAQTPPSAAAPTPSPRKLPPLVYSRNSRTSTS